MNLYPGYPPQFKTVRKTGGFSRDCLVIELLSLDTLTDSELQTIKAEVENSLRVALTKVANLEKTSVVTSDKFDIPLNVGLRF